MSFGVGVFIFNYVVDRSSRNIFLNSKKIEKNTIILKKERERTRVLLTSIVPQSHFKTFMMREADKKDVCVCAEKVKSATILFSDIVSFTQLCTNLTPSQVVELLDTMFRNFDFLAEKHGLERLKTIGDAYVVIGNVVNNIPDSHARQVVAFALDIVKYVSTTKDFEKFSPNLQIRVGIHSDSIVSGLIITNTIVFDAWGRGITIAEQVENKAPRNRIMVSDTTHSLTRDMFAFFFFFLSLFFLSFLISFLYIL
eukprot:TRINITY_DN10452_c1_g1_i4.p1 TRINITY_DN10452_c1_g1~~TRINITY_DN10452_c1_g1_i4.p1  ORF type:complete len:254 (-),score=51.74 TRINITY_DN10452_c1_g1_i4:16-777(-)